MKKIIILLLAILSLSYLFINNYRKNNIIPDEAIRFRIIANSNTIYDQDIKIKVKNVVQNKIKEIIKDSKNIDETRKILEDNIDILDDLVKNTLKNLNYDKDYKINYGLNYFPKKEYKGRKYNDGKYESLVITLGDGNGNNWWCVLFPPFCMEETDENIEKNVEYTFFLKDFLKKYVSIK